MGLAQAAEILKTLMPAYTRTIGRVFAKNTPENPGWHLKRLVSAN